MYTWIVQLTLNIGQGLVGLWLRLVRRRSCQQLCQGGLIEGAEPLRLWLHLYSITGHCLRVHTFSCHDDTHAHVHTYVQHIQAQSHRVT